jgi:hypothetical protein
MAAAKTKAEQIIDENAVGMYLYSPPAIDAQAANGLSSSCLQQVILPIL